MSNKITEAKGKLRKGGKSVGRHVHRLNEQQRWRKSHKELTRRLDLKALVEAKTKDAAHHVEGFFHGSRESLSDKLAKIAAIRNGVPLKDFIAARKAAQRLNRR